MSAHGSWKSREDVYLHYDNIIMIILHFIIIVHYLDSLKGRNPPPSPEKSTLFYHWMFKLLKLLNFILNYQKYV